MSAPTKFFPTAAEAELAERFDAIVDRLPGTDSVRMRRRDAFTLFRSSGLPHRRVEEWKYSDLRARMKSAAPLADAPTAAEANAALASAGDTFDALPRFRLVLVDGAFQPTLSDTDALRDEGVEVAGLADRLDMDGQASLDLLAVPDVAGSDVAIALNTAFAADGVVISVRDGAEVPRPVEILHVGTPRARTARYARNRISLGANAAIFLFENLVGGAPDSETNLVFDYRLGRDARLTVARQQNEHAGAIHIASTFAELAAGASLKHLTVAAGAGFARNQTFVSFAGNNASLELFGATMVDGTRHSDQTLFIDHAVPDCVSAETFKTVADDRGSAVFQGKIIVRPDAQKTNGKMMSQALLLSEEAEMDSKPELEIFADDVLCGHGATSGRIDETMLFYLMTRGIPRFEAEQLLVEAFLDDAIDAIGNEAVADVLKDTVSAWLVRRGGEA